ncbi:MAG TPA: DUF4384 domain-containing protein, partial [Thermomonas sp.]|nr:DUF4384 domain-containing protein [Thermomonas sp.]
VKQRISALEGVKSADVQVQLRIWPHCEVVKILEPFEARNKDSGYGLTVTPSTGHSDRFIEGEKVTIKVTQANFDGYLYVDYYFVDGNMAHIFPHPNEPDSGRLVKAGETLVIGNTPEGWEVGAPFGQELITVISSPTPLYDGALPTFDKAEDYLPKLRQMLDANRGNTKLVATYLFMQTEPAR